MMAFFAGTLSIVSRSARGNPKADLRILFVADDFDDPSLTRLISLILIPVV